MDTVCPIDVKCPSQISALLRPPSPPQVQEYYEKLIAERECRGLQVKQNCYLGKGVYANLDFEEGELVLKDQMLVGSQHPSNKIDCLVCSFCFYFIGSIELQIGRKLYLKSLGASTSNGCDKAMHIPKYHGAADSSSEKDDSFNNGHQNLDECASSSSGNKVSLPNEVVESLLNGEMTLPHSNKFPLPSAMACPGGCAEAYYCSKSCAEADWESSHSLLCTGQRSESPCKEALLKFIQHAAETNDIFLLAAKVCINIINFLIPHFLVFK
uniref:Histone-lysine N-methyltransferase ATXR2 isoform X2 n=1 Tax=Rhizophora mucronata TaxID=61149 RepID=A0A2P2M6V9_RHIMU